MKLQTKSDIVMFGCFLIIETALGNAVPKGFLEPPDMPVCSAHNSICHLSMNVTIDGADSSSYITDGNQLCRCPGDVICPVTDVTSDRAIEEEFRGQGETLNVKMSFCHLDLPTRICAKNEPVVTLKGSGPMMMGTFGNFRCRCKRALYAHRSWTEGSFNFIEYSCGKALCHRIHTGKNDNPVCMTVANQKLVESSVPYYKHSYICRCRNSEDCIIAGGLPSVPGEMSYAFCQEKSKSYSLKL